jgi:hypothetical protein
MVWQAPLEGAQIWTLAKAPLRYGFVVGNTPRFTEIGTTLAMVPAGETVIGNEAVTAELALEVATTVATDVVVTVAGAV